MPVRFYADVENQHILDSVRTKLGQTAGPPLDSPIGLTSQQAARALGISVRSLKRLEERGLIKSCKALRRRIFARRELERFLEENS